MGISRTEISISIVVLCSFLIVAFYAIFILSYFPHKHSIRVSNSISSANNNNNNTPNGEIDFEGYKHVVLIVIDAMRYDFISDPQTPMTFTQFQINNGNGLLFKAKVSPPTVTLPRIKAITTGSIPGFLDVIMNFGSDSLQEDNIITQMKSLGKKMIFYGDDTWIRLFPQHFYREEGTTSFFVTDYTEVDNNVTHHLNQELVSLDWDMMILHYLGLDHIGHMSGPKSSLIQPKLQEMDEIIEKIFKGLSQVENEESIIVICGDHGMSDQGGHGGASLSEITVPIVFLYPSKYSSTSHSLQEKVESDVLQIDLAPTLAALNNIPIPVNNLGTVILNSLYKYNPTQTLNILYYNTLQIVDLLKFNNKDYENNAGYILYKETNDKYRKWLNDTSKTNEIQSLITSYKHSIELTTDVIKESSTNYDLHGIYIAIIYIWLMFIVLLTIQCTSQPNYQYTNYSVTVIIFGISIGIFSHLLVCTSQYSSQLICSTNNMVSVLVQLCRLLGLALFLYMVSLKDLWKNCSVFKKFIYLNIVEKFLIIGTILHSVSFLSSSFVEEEHQTWYFYIVTVHLLILYQTIVSVCGLDLNHCSAKSENSSKNKENVVDLKKVWLKSRQSVISMLTLLILFRILRSWNQTGNKWLDFPDIGDYLIRPENKDLLTVLTVVSLSIILVLQYTNKLQCLVLVLCLLSTYWYRSSIGSLNHLHILPSSTSGSIEARINFVFILTLIGECVMSWKRNENPEKELILIKVKKIQTIWIAVMVLILRTSNITLVCLLVMAEKIISDYILPHAKLKIPFLTVYCYWIGQASFFYQGNSNALSTIDVSAGYIGLQSYQPVITAILMICSTYSCLVFWFITLVKHIIIETQCKIKLFEASLISMCIKTLPLVLYTVLVTIQRYHLFVWTVFSPKVLYEGALLLLVSLISILLITISVFLPNKKIKS